MATGVGAPDRGRASTTRSPRVSRRSRVGRLLLALTPASLALLFACDQVPGDTTSDFSSGPRPARGYAWVILGTDTVVAEVADTPEEHQQGLMFREELADGEGMLFVFEQESIQAFYMRNTYIPLDIAFMDESQVIVDIQQMEPLTEDLHRSSEPAMFALEVPQGWFEARAIPVGQIARIIFGRP